MKGKREEEKSLIREEKGSKGASGGRGGEKGKKESNTDERRNNGEVVMTKGDKMRESEGRGDKEEG